MKNLALIAVLACGLATQAAANGTGYSQDSKYVIIVSCFRGPLTDVIWDRPNAKFIDSLINVGYDYPTASAIGERICRDDALVDNTEGLRSEMIRVFEESPKYHNPNIRIKK